MTTVIAASLFAAGWTILILVVAVAKRIRDRIAHGWLCVSNVCFLTGGITMGSNLTAGIAAGSLALTLWLWWHSGGGDGTKRRLKRWARKFEGVRRTAPAAAS